MARRPLLSFRLYLRRPLYALVGCGCVATLLVAATAASNPTEPGTPKSWLEPPQKGNPVTHMGPMEYKGKFIYRDMEAPQPLPRTVEAYYGIRYAQPPTGDLRLQLPRPWLPPEGHVVEDVSNATRPAQCMQPEQSVPWFHMSEDCLFLNVYKPQNASNLPVLVFLHDGKFVTGGVTDYDHPQMSAVHNVVLVTLNYRLGALGFMATEELKNEGGGTTGNYGLKDQQLALQWVQQNVKSFGGDANRVSLYGVSAGAMSVLWHLTSEQSAGLFHKAIVSSGSVSSLFFQPYEDAVTFWKWYQESILQCESIACLRKVNPSDFVIPDSWSANSAPAPWSNLFFPVAPVGPVVDGSREGLLENPLQAIVGGRFNKVPVMIGSTKDEGSVFQILVHKIAPGTSFPPSLGDFRRIVEHTFPYEPEKVQTVLDLYDADDIVTAKDEFDKMQRYMRDSVFGCGVQSIAEAVASHGVPVYTYTLSENLIPDVLGNLAITKGDGLTLGDIGAYHTGDRWLVFKAFSTLTSVMQTYVSNLLAKGQPPTIDSYALGSLQMNQDYELHAQKMHHVSDTMSCAWANFVTCGRPQCRECKGKGLVAAGKEESVHLPTWKDFGESGQFTRITADGGSPVAFPGFGDDSVPEFPRREVCEFFKASPFQFYDVRQKYSPTTETPWEDLPHASDTSSSGATCDMPEPGTGTTAVPPHTLRGSGGPCFAAQATSLSERSHVSLYVLLAALFHVVFLECLV